MIISEKIPGGKLVTLDVEIENTYNTIKKIKITGDFFLHPEESIISIEKGLEGTAINSVSAKITQLLEKNNAQFIGATPNDIERLAKKAVS